jgi:hypothetical protein
MLGAGMPVTSLQRYLVHEHLHTTMIYAEVTNPSLQKDYYQGISTIDLHSEKTAQNAEEPSYQETLLKLVQELQTPDLSPTERDEILVQMQSLLEGSVCSRRRLWVSLALFSTIDMPKAHRARKRKGQRVEPSALSMVTRVSARGRTPPLPLSSSRVIPWTC